MQTLTAAIAPTMLMGAITRRHGGSDRLQAKEFKMNITSAANISNGINKIKSAINIAMNNRGEGDDHEELNTVLEKISDMQDALFFLHNEVVQLQKENARLNSRLREMESWERKISAYRLIETKGGSFVYQSDTKPLHYICPVCTRKEQIQILQNKKDYTGEFHCPGCDREFPVNHRSVMK